MLHSCDATRFLEETGLRLRVRFVQAENFECQDTGEWARLTNFIDMSETPSADKVDNFVDTNLCPLDKEITNIATDRPIRILMFSTWIETASQISIPPQSMYDERRFRLRFCAHLCG